MTLPLDRRWAVEDGGGEFDPIHPRHFPKVKFLQLMSNRSLAALETRFDAAGNMLTILRGGHQVAHRNLDQKIGRQIIEQFISAYLGREGRGNPRIVSSEGHHFCDVPDPVLSLINLASVRDFERVASRKIDPLRFRGNVYIDGVEPWAEFEWLGRPLAVNGNRFFKVGRRIDRCAAANVEPSTGNRDMQIPRLLQEVFGPRDCGVYLNVTRNGTIVRGDQIAPC